MRAASTIWESSGTMSTSQTASVAMETSILEISRAPESRRSIRSTSCFTIRRNLSCSALFLVPAVNAVLHPLCTYLDLVVWSKEYGDPLRVLARARRGLTIPAFGLAASILALALVLPALARGRALAANGRLHDALALLETIRPTDAQKPEGDRLRADIQRQLLGIAAAISAPPSAGEPADGRVR